MKPVALITGASKGIGRALARQYAAQGYNLILTSRDTASLEPVVSECSILGAQCRSLVMEMTRTADFLDKLNEVPSMFGRLDVLINNAGISQRSLASQTSAEVVRKLMEVNFLSAVEITLKLLPEIIKQKGRIVVVSSYAGLIGFPLRSAYAASKFAMNGYFDTLGIEEQEISVTIACPSRIKTDISKSALKGDGTEHGIMDREQQNGIDADYCAKKIYRAAEKRKRWVHIARKERILIFIHKWCLPLFYFLVNRIYKKMNL